MFPHDWIQLFDFVEVVEGHAATKTGHVVQVRPNGYLSIADDISLMMDETVSVCSFEWFCSF
jgi:hypothetical protein